MNHELVEPIQTERGELRKALLRSSLHLSSLDLGQREGSERADSCNEPQTRGGSLTGRSSHKWLLDSPHGAMGCTERLHEDHPFQAALLEGAL